VKYPIGYLHWSANGSRNAIRQLLGEPGWGTDLMGAIPAGLDITKEVIDKYYSRFRSVPGYDCRTYADFREMLEKERNIDAVKVITPDHQHACNAIAVMNKGKHVIMHKPVANKINEARAVLETARKTGVVTHLLAWADRPQFQLVKKWIDEGAIGTLREVHNWSYRPVWEQFTKIPADTPPIPAGFNWELWLGPVPDRPFHPKYTHSNFRGWYEFGAGSVADMGIYSHHELFTTFGITALPTSIEAWGTTTREVNQNHAFQWVNNTVGFPYSCIIKWKFPAAGSSPKLDLFWYDGGMKPPRPEELEIDNIEMPQEGMLLVGDKGKILGGFNCQNPRIIPEAKMVAHTGSAVPPQISGVDATDVWIECVRNNKQSPGSFGNIAVYNETTLLAAVALRAGKRIEYDPVNVRVTNVPEADRYLRREEYRKGWEI